jgi:hypothetical protein
MAKELVQEAIDTLQAALQGVVDCGTAIDDALSAQIHALEGSMNGVDAPIASRVEAARDTLSDLRRKNHSGIAASVTVIKAEVTRLQNAL